MAPSRVAVGAALLVVGQLLAPAAAASAPATGRAPAEAGPSPGCDELLPDPPAAHARLGADRAWQTATGRGVVVAVVDSGVDAANVHLAGAVLEGVDLVGGGADPYGWTDAAGHGTAVAAVIAAREVEGSGLVGLAPDATVLPVRVYVEDSDRARDAGVAPSTARIADGIVLAARAGARVINVSLTSPSDEGGLLAAAVATATERGALVVASAGNRSPDEEELAGPRYPAAIDGVLGVTAVDATDTVTEASVHGPHVDVAAPGTDVLATAPGGLDCALTGDPSASWATAYVSAAAALVAQAYPDETPAQWAHRLQVTAARHTVDERDDRAGWGVVRPTAALTFVDDGSAPGPPSPVHAAPVRVPPAAPDPVLGAAPDPLEPVRGIAVWWVLAGVVAVVGAVLASLLVPGRRRPPAGP